MPKTVEKSDRYDLKRPIVLVGMMGAGKTAIGRSLSGVLGVPFLDSDLEIVEAAQASIAEIFERDGEAFFREREAEVIARLLSSGPCVLSTGGGAFLAERNRISIAEYGTSVWLDATLELLWERVRHKDTRPLLRTSDPKSTLEQIFGQRTPIYEKAQLRIQVQESASIEETTMQVVDLLKGHPEILEYTA